MLQCCMVHLYVRVCLYVPGTNGEVCTVILAGMQAHTHRDRNAGRQTDRQTDRQQDIQIDRIAGRQTDRQTSRQSKKMLLDASVKHAVSHLGAYGRVGCVGFDPQLVHAL